MRTVIGCIGLLTSLLCVGCGQMGALQLPSDPDFDKRSKYLIYKGTPEQTQSSKKTQEQVEHPADEETATPENTEQN